MPLNRAQSREARHANKNKIAKSFNNKILKKMQKENWKKKLWFWKLWPKHLLFQKWQWGILQKINENCSTALLHLEMKCSIGQHHDHDISCFKFHRCKLLKKDLSWDFRRSSKCISCVGSLVREQSEISERKKEKTAKTRQKLCKWISLIHFHQIPDVLSADSRYPIFMTKSAK